MSSKRLASSGFKPLLVPFAIRHCVVLFLVLRMVLTCCREIDRLHWAPGGNEQRVSGEAQQTVVAILAIWPSDLSPPVRSGF
jgi:hypothetical protein